MFAKIKSKNLFRKDGVVLITVLITMTLLIMLASALFLTITAERTDIYEESRSEQVYQSAISVDGWVFDYIERYSTSLPVTFDLDDIKDPLIRHMLLGMDEGDWFSTNPNPGVDEGVPLSGSGIMGDYEITITLVHRCDSTGTPSLPCTDPKYGCDGDPGRIFEIETIVRNGIDEEIFTRLVEYKGGIVITPGTPSGGGGGSFSDDDGFFELPASYRGQPSIAGAPVPMWNTLNILGRTYFGGVGPGQSVFLNGHSDFQHDVHSFDSITIAGESTVTAPPGVPSYPIVLNGWRDVTIAGTNMNNADAFPMRGGVVRTGGNFVSQKGIGGYTTIYCFGNVTVNGNAGGANVPGGSMVGSDVVIFAAGNVTITGTVGSGTSIYANGTVSVNGATVAPNGPWDFRSMGPTSPTPFNYTNSIGEQEHSMIDQFLRMMDMVGYYTDEGFPRKELVPNGGGGLLGTDFIFTYRCIREECTCPGGYIACIALSDHCDNPGTCADQSHTNANVRLRLHFSGGFLHHEVEIINAVPGVSTAFQPYWAPKWRPQVNDNTLNVPKYVTLPSGVPRENVNSDMLNTPIIINASAFGSSGINNAVQYPATNSIKDFAGLGGTVNNAMVINGSGYIGGNGNRAPDNHTIIINTMDCAHLNSVLCGTGVTGCNIDNPVLHKNIFIELRPNGTDGQFRWRQNQDQNPNSPYLNILIRGAGSVVFVTSNTADHWCDNGRLLDNSICPNPACTMPNSIDVSTNYGWGGNVFVGHMAWVKEMQDYVFHSSHSANGSSPSPANINTLNGVTATSNLAVAMHAMAYGPVGNPPEFRNYFLDSIPLHAKVDDCGNSTCHYCLPANKKAPEGHDCSACSPCIWDTATFAGYGFEMGRMVLRQDSGSNWVTKHGQTGTRLYIHNNVLFVDDMDSAGSESTFYGNRNIIFGYVYAPGSRWKDAAWGPLNDPLNHYSNIVGGFIYGDLGAPINMNLRTHMRITHIMPMDYYRGPDGRMIRNVVSDMVGKSYRGMTNGTWAPYEGAEEVKTSRPGTFRTVGYR